MALCVKVKKSDSQKVKQEIISQDLFDKKYVLKKDGDYIFFPIKDKSNLEELFPEIEFENVDCKERIKHEQSLKNAIDLEEKEKEFLKRAFDTVGTIAILEIPDELAHKEKHIANTLLSIQKNLKTVLKKAGIHGTEFRTQDMVYLAGYETKETIHRESNTRLKVNVETVYFSPRLSSERMRIADQVKPGEEILVMFSGCAPYPCVISRNTEAKYIIGIEKNPEGHRYGVENIKLNKIKNVDLINADVKDAIPSLDKKFDRIIMPLPKTAGDFLDTALMVSKKGTIINFYAFEDEGNFKAAEDRIISACKNAKKECKILKTTKCGQQSPKTFRICVDFIVQS